MTRKDASGTPQSKWRLRLSMVVGVLVIAGVCMLAKSFWGPGSATAQGRNSGRRNTQARTARNTNPRGGRPEAVRPAANNNLAAIVNGESLTRAYLAKEAIRRHGKDVIESLVNRSLIKIACQQRGVKITKEDVDKEIQRTASKFGLSPSAYIRLLDREKGISPLKLKQEVVWPLLALRQLAKAEIRVTPQEIQQAIESEYGPKVKVRMIAVRSLDKARQILAVVQKDPAKFGDVAKNHSEDRNSASAWGFIPPIRKHVGVKELEQVAFALEKGQISRIVKIGDQHIILKCEQPIAGSTIPNKHRAKIEAQLADRMRDRKLRAAAAKLFKRLQDEAKVVNVYNDPRLRSQMPGIAASINGRHISMRELGNECIKRFGLDVLEGEINRKILNQALTRRRGKVTRSDLDEEILRAADLYAFHKPDGSPDMNAWLENIKKEGGAIDIYIEDAVWPSVALKILVRGNNSVKVTEEDLRKSFEANFGERVNVLAVVLTNQRQAQKVWGLARDNPTDRFFGELAHEYSAEPTSRANYGKVPPIRMYGGQPLMEKEAFRMKPGDISGILSSGNKFIILRCLGRTKPVVKDFKAVKAELTRDILEKKMRVAMAKEFDRLKKSAQIQNLIDPTQSQAGTRRTKLLPFRVAPSTPSANQPRGGQRRR